MNVKTTLKSAIDKLETHLRQSEESRKGAEERYQHLRVIFTDETLSEFDLQLTNFLLTNVFGHALPSVMLSDLLDRRAIEEY